MKAIHYIRIFHHEYLMLTCCSTVSILTSNDKYRGRFGHMSLSLCLKHPAGCFNYSAKCFKHPAACLKYLAAYLDIRLCVSNSFETCDRVLDICLRCSGLFISIGFRKIYWKVKKPWRQGCCNILVFFHAQNWWKYNDKTIKPLYCFTKDK